MKVLKNVSENPITLSSLTSPSIGLETLTLGAGEEYDISDREQDFSDNADVLTNVRNGNLQVGNGGVFYSDEKEGGAHFLWGWDQSGDPPQIGDCNSPNACGGYL
mgnify:CR=1 FL=1